MICQTETLVRQSGVIPYRFNAITGEIEILLVTTRSGNRHVFPKGNLERGLTQADSAAKEAFEEAGVRGLVERETSPIASYRYTKKRKGRKRVHHVDLYPMHVTVEHGFWPEKHKRHRIWRSMPDAFRILNPDSELTRVLHRFARDFTRPSESMAA